MLWSLGVRKTRVFLWSVFMAGLVIVGTQWGDEGKGKIVDLLSDRADLVVRYQGGHNAGHTIVLGSNTFILHLVPSGIFHPGKLCVIGSGVVVDPAAFLEEIQFLRDQGIQVEGRLRISAGAHLIMPYHKVIEKESEKLKGARRIGTTGRGIGPAYVDKMARIGIRVGDLLNERVFREKLSVNLSDMNYLLENLYKVEGLNFDRVCDDYIRFGGQIRNMVVDASLVINEALDQGKLVLFEGAQGTHLDIDHGTYPYVTSSNAIAGGACTGAGIGPTKIESVIGVVKAYTTRVGSGPFPTELNDDTGIELQKRGHEFGATTGRPRRCGWMDTVLVRYASRVNGLTGIALTKLDVLDSCPEIKIGIRYSYRGQVLSEMPLESAILMECEPVYEMMPGWQKPTTGITEYHRLPVPAKNYISRLEELVGCPIHLISTGSRREDTIQRSGLLKSRS